jgi:uncharacterized membrane protein YuzA (DUF378 family)
MSTQNFSKTMLALIFAIFVVILGALSLLSFLGLYEWNIIDLVAGAVAGAASTLLNLAFRRHSNRSAD